MTTSCQFRPQPHSSGTAAISATSGTATKTPTRKRWNVGVVSSSRSGRAGRGWVLVVLPTGPADAGMVGDVARPAVVASTALTVSGDVVIVLLGYRRRDRSAYTLT